MTRVIALGMVILAITSPAALAADEAPDQKAARDASRKDLEKLQGTWTLVRMEAEGENVLPEHFEGWHSIYQGDALTLKAGDVVRRRGIVTLDASRTPRAINTWDVDGPFADQVVPGIYELAGDNLKLCFARPGQDRPSEFTTKNGTGFLVVVYERKKP
jgi:uncharacterized protein (TIGR03067 family)